MKTPPRPILLISSATAFSLLGDQFLYAVLPSYYDNIGLLPIHVGILLSINRWVRLATNPLAERAYRRYPVGALVSVAFLLGSMLTAVYATVTLFPVLLIARVLWGLCWSFIRQAAIMTVVDASHSGHIGGYMGFYNGISRAGSLVGMVVGGLGHDLLGSGTTLLAFAAISLGAVPCGALSRRGLMHVPYSERIRSDFREDRGLVAAAFIVGLVGAGFVMSTLGYLLEARAGSGIDLLGSSVGVASLTGLVLGIRWATGLIGAPLLGAFTDWLGRSRAALLFFGVGGIALIVTAPTRGILPLVVGVVAVLVATTGLQVLQSAEAGMRGPGTVVSYATASDLGGAAGPILAWGALQIGLPREGILLAGGVLYVVGAVISRRSSG